MKLTRSKSSPLLKRVAFLDTFYTVLNKAINHVLSDCELSFTTYNHSKHGTIIGTMTVRIIVPCSEPPIIVSL